MLPPSVLFFNAFGMFWYQTFDAIDGKQARKTDNCSPLGQLLDHNLDQLNFSIFACQGIGLLRMGGKLGPILMVVCGQLLPHYTAEYRKHFTKFYITAMDMAGGIQIGATEQLLIMYGLQIMFACFPNSNQSASNEFDLQKTFGLPFALTLTLGDQIMLGTLILSLQFNFSNLAIGFDAAEDKTHAFMCMIPGFQIIGMIVLASYSQFWDQYCILFIYGAGNLLTMMTGNMNLRTCAGMRYNPWYLDPPVFLAILYCDTHRLFPKEYIALAYLLLVINRTARYFLFLRSIIVQLCDYLQIPFIRVKQAVKKD